MSTATQQPDPLQLAEWLDFWSQPTAKKAAAALRRLHAENQQLRADLEAVSAGGVGPLIPTTVQHQIKLSRNNDLQRESGHSSTSSSTAPQPLTDEQIDTLEWSVPQPGEDGAYLAQRRNVRAIERAHGIGGEA